LAQQDFNQPCPLKRNFNDLAKRKEVQRFLLIKGKQ